VKRQKVNKFFFRILVVVTVVVQCNVVFAEGPISVEIKDNRISLLAEQRAFREVFDALARKVHFDVKIPSELGAKRISIRFTDLDVDRAIVRLFSLVQEKNYKVKYDPSGKVVKVEVITAKRISDEKAGGRVRDSITRKKDSRTKSGSRVRDSITRKKDSRTKSRYTPRRAPRRYRPQSGQSQATDDIPSTGITAPDMPDE